MEFYTYPKPSYLVRFRRNNFICSGTTLFTLERVYLIITLLTYSRNKELIQYLNMLILFRLFLENHHKYLLCLQFFLPKGTHLNLWMIYFFKMYFSDILFFRFCPIGIPMDLMWRIFIHSCCIQNNRMIPSKPPNWKRYNTN